ncbi:hypothetical protein PV325_011889 [Microctonus aethiopoides]|nr:hypothetical protein PV325_011889 [Microctonus aethiopoides]
MSLRQRRIAEGMVRIGINVRERKSGTSLTTKSCDPVVVYLIGMIGGTTGRKVEVGSAAVGTDVVGGSNSKSSCNGGEKVQMEEDEERKWLRRWHLTVYPRPYSGQDSDNVIDDNDGGDNDDNDDDDDDDYDDVDDDDDDNDDNGKVEPKVHLGFLCSRVELTSVPGGQNAMAHLKKRKLEAESGVTKPIQQSITPLNGKKPLLQGCGNSGGIINSSGLQHDMETFDAATKRRRKSIRDDEVRKAMDIDKSISLPQKKRVFTSANLGSPVRKSSKNSDEPEDDETLIRETEAALKSLSGSWPGPSGSMYQRGNSDEDKYASNFENLFEEKKDNPKMSPSSMSTSSTTSNETGCSLKDVITYRGQQDRRSFHQNRQQDPNKPQLQHLIKPKKELEGMIKMETDCGTSILCSMASNDSIKMRSMARTLTNKDRNDRDQIRHNDKYSRYDPPDFNELVDDSSNELEIDMSDPLADNERDHRPDERDKDRTGKSNGSPQNPLRQQHHSQQHLYANYQRYPETGLKVSSATASSASSPSSSSSAFSASSAFRPPNTDHTKTSCRTPVAASSTSSPPIGPYPASATFVGFPTPVPGPVMPVPQPVLPSSAEEKHSSVSLLQLKSPKEEHQVQRDVVAAGSIAVNKTTGPGLPPVTSPDTSSLKQYTILQPAGVGSRAATAIQDIAREGVVSVAAVSSSGGSSNNSTSNYTTTGVNHKNITNNQVNNNVTSGNSSNSNSITTNTITTTTTCPTAVGDLSTTTGTGHSDAMKMSDRSNFDGSRPSMSMSPSSIGRGEGF